MYSAAHHNIESHYIYISYMKYSDVKKLPWIVKYLNSDILTDIPSAAHCNNRYYSGWSN